MRRSVVSAVMAGVLVTGVGVSAGVPARAGSVPAVKAVHRGPLPMSHLDPADVGDFGLPEAPAGQTPAERADWVRNSVLVGGKSANGWVDFAIASLDAPAEGVGTTAPVALTTEIGRIYGALGLHLTPADTASVLRQAAAMPASLRTPFSQLVSSVADAYVAQVPVANEVLANFAAGFDAHRPPLSDVARDDVAARSAALTSAVQTFRASTASTFAALPPTAGPIFADPEGLVVLGGTGNDTYTRSGLLPDPVLLVDPAGSDTYLNSAGGACPVTPVLERRPPLNPSGRWLECNSLVLSLVADLGDGTTGPSDDVYQYDGPPAAVQGAGGPGGIGILIDVGGNDDYVAKMTRGNTEPFVTYYFDGGAQGYGYAGEGLLLDGVGDDYYRFDVAATHGKSIWAFAQGFGGGGGIGLSVDGDGEDRWISRGLGLNGNEGFQGVYTDGVGIYGGVGVMADLGADDDIYYSIDSAETTDYYALGFGAFGGLGVLYEDGGNDSYKAIERATNPWINPLLSCAFGTASFGGVGVMVDLTGNDYYLGEIQSPHSTSIMNWGAGGPGVAYGVFVDGTGDDWYELLSVGTSTHEWGWGYWEPAVGGDVVNNPVGGNTFGAYVDAGGQDTYLGGPEEDIGNDQVWAFGADFNS